MRGILVRVAIDQAFGKWNGPVDPDTREFVYVSIPDTELRAGLETPYALAQRALGDFAANRVVDARACELPVALGGSQMHLDPDFGHLTYGDKEARGRDIAGFAAGDVIVFYSGLRPCRPIAQKAGKLVYAIIGIFRVDEVVRVDDVVPSRWHENAHTRRATHRPTDVIVRGQKGASGRLRRCMPIGEYRDRAYRVRHDLLDAWGDLTVTDGYIHRSAVPPRFLKPEQFLKWFDAQQPELLAVNNLSAA
jgi:hypothetical protein